MSLQDRRPGMSLFEAISRRKSCRTFNGEPLASEHLALLKGLGRTAPRLGDRPVRFAFIEGVAQTEAILTGVIGSYGKTKGAPALLVGIVKSGPLAHESLAFTMEYLILEATRHNIGSCWISGTFDRRRLAGELTLAAGEEIPVVAPIGYPAAQPGLGQSFLRKIAGAGHRKSLREIVFVDHWEGSSIALLGGRPEVRKLAEAVQRAPSAINRQPWRLIFAQSMMALASVSKGAGLDLGIAMAHWSIAAQDEKLPGAWNLTPDRERLAHEMQIPATAQLVAVWE